MQRFIFLGLLLFLSAGLAPLRAADSPDEAEIRHLNADYVRSFLACDVQRFSGLLADDFQGILADGRLIDRAQFLSQAAVRPDAKDFRLHEVVIRVFGDGALVEARVTYRRTDGTEVQTRYTDIYVRRSGKWQIVSGQWTRVAKP